MESEGKCVVSRNIFNCMYVVSVYVCNINDSDCLLQTGECVGVLEGHQDVVKCLCLEESMDGTTILYSASYDRTIRQWNAKVSL